MERFNYWVDILLVICLLSLTFTGFVMAYAVPYVPGGSDATFLGEGRGEWVHWHINIGWIMITLMFLHFILHFNWLKCMTVDLFNRKTTKV